MTASALDPRTPVLVGQAQWKQRVDDPADAAEPLALMERVARLAAEDAGAPGLLAALDSIRVPRGVWRYANPAAWLRERFGAPGAETGLAPISGSTVQRLVAHAACEIAAGRRDVVLVVGAEAEHTKRRARKAGVELDWTEQAGPPPDETFGSHDPGFGPWEARHRIRPIQAFSLIENALRIERGEDPVAHRERIARLWAGFSEVAAGNPFAWNREGMSAAEIAEETPENRLVAWPYTKYLVANMVVDLAAAVILTSVEAARRHGVPETSWIFPLAATDVFRTPPLSERTTLHGQPAMAVGGRRALELASIAPEAIDHVDLYSCFPSAVQVAAGEIGFPQDRPLTVTGGLTFAGGPFNSYVLHAIATLVQRLREDRDGTGYLSSVGGYMAKHAFGVYAARAPDAGFRYEDCTDEAIAASETLEVVEDVDAEVQVEAFAQMPGKSGPEHLLVAGRLADGRRTWPVTDDPSLLQAMRHEELGGRKGRVRGGVVTLE